MSRRLIGVVLIVIAVAASAACGGSKSTTSAETTSTAASVPFDRAFIDAMVPHHESAIAMARAAKTAGLSDPELIEIADDIISSQQREIDDMRGWREDWFGSSTIDPEGADSLGFSEAEMGMEHDADFSGAADVDQEFATAMIAHHRGAIRMAKLAQTRGQHGEIKDLADAIIAAQEREIGLMDKHAGAMEHGG